MNIRLIAVVAFTLLCGSRALAQSHPQSRDGFTISAGLGAGSGGVTCSDCSTDRENSLAGYIRLGGAFHPNLILGGEVNGWSKTTDLQGDKATVTFTTVNAIAQWYPQPTGGFFVTGGLGVGSLRAEFTIPGAASLTDKTTGLGWQVGTGYDIRLARNFSITPYATYFATSGGKVKSSDAKLDANVVQAGLGLTWH